jgi:hypothetical protein
MAPQRFIPTEREVKEQNPAFSMYSEIIRKYSQHIRLNFDAVGERAGGAPDWTL